MKHPPARARILAVAEEQLITTGYSAITMDRLADELGMSKRTLYEHFPSKESVFEAILHAKSAEITHILRRVIESDDHFIVKITTMLSQWQQCLGAVLNPHILSDFKRNAPGLWKTTKELRDHNIKSLWTAILTEGKEKGYVRKSVNNDFMIFMWIAVFEKAIEEFVLPGVYSVADLRTWILETFLHGILSDKGRPLAKSILSKQSIQ